MKIRDPLTDEVAKPPPGTIRIAVWRHLTPGSSDAEAVELHRQRARLVHVLVQAARLDVRDWGNVDAEHPAEVVELLAAEVDKAASGAVVSLVVNFLWNRLKERRKSAEVLKAVTFRRSDGAEIVWHFQHPVSADVAKRELARFLEGEPASACWQDRLFTRVAVA
jgi:hypothetical protein